MDSMSDHAFIVTRFIATFQEVLDRRLRRAGVDIPTRWAFRKLDKDALMAVIPAETWPKIEGQEGSKRARTESGALSSTHALPLRMEVCQFGGSAQGGETDGHISSAY